MVSGDDKELWSLRALWVQVHAQPLPASLIGSWSLGLPIVPSYCLCGAGGHAASLHACVLGLNIGYSLDVENLQWVTVGYILDCIFICIFS